MKDPDPFILDFGKELMERDPYITRVLIGPEGYVLIVKRLLFHWTLLQNEIGNHQEYECRWCYQTEELAIRAAQDWKERDFEDVPKGWHKNAFTGELDRDWETRDA